MNVLLLQLLGRLAFWVGLSLGVGLGKSAEGKSAVPWDGDTFSLLPADGVRWLSLLFGLFVPTGSFTLEEAGL